MRPPDFQGITSFTQALYMSGTSLKTISLFEPCSESFPLPYPSVRFCVQRVLQSIYLIGNQPARDWDLLPSLVIIPTRDATPPPTRILTVRWFYVVSRTVNYNCNTRGVLEGQSQTYTCSVFNRTN